MRKKRSEKGMEREDGGGKWRSKKSTKKDNVGKNVKVKKTKERKGRSDEGRE